jgi:hypothetical protein
VVPTSRRRSRSSAFGSPTPAARRSKAPERGRALQPSRTPSCALALTTVFVSLPREEHGGRIEEERYPRHRAIGPHCAGHYFGSKAPAPTGRRPRALFVLTFSRTRRLHAPHVIGDAAHVLPAPRLQRLRPILYSARETVERCDYLFVSFGTLAISQVLRTIPEIRKVIHGEPPHCKFVRVADHLTSTRKIIDSTSTYGSSSADVDS